MRTAVIFSALGLAALGACTDPQRSGQPTTVTSGPQLMPGNSAPASPAGVWTTEGGPASPGAPSSGNIEQRTTRDGGL